MRWLLLSARFVASLLSVAVLLLLVLLAIYASLGRLYMPRLAEQRDTVALYLQENIPVPIEFESLEGDWRQLSPIIRLQGIEARSVIKGSEWHFHADDVFVEVDVIRSLLYQQPILRDISIEGGAVSMRGDRMSLMPQDNAGTPAAPHALSDLLAAILNLGVITISDSRVRLELPDMVKPRSLVLSASLQRQDNFRRMKADIRFDGDDPASLSMLVEADQSLTGGLNVIEWYGHWDNVQLDHWLDSVDWGDEVKIARAISGEVWGYWVPGDDVRLHGKVEAPALALTVKGKTWPVLEQFSASFLMERDDSLQWDIQLPGLAFKCRGVNAPWQHLRLRYAPGEAMQLQLGQVDLDGARALLDALGFGHEALSSLKPQGLLRSVAVDIKPRPGSGALDWRFRSYLENVSIGSWHGAPSATGVSGFVEVNRQGGYVDLDAGEQFSMGFPKVYTDVMHFSRAQARVGWRIHEHGVVVGSSLIRLQSPEGNARGLLALDLPKHDTGRDPWMSLVIGLENAPASARNKYIPATISAGLQHWLDESIGEGHISKGGFIFDGPIKHSERKPAVQLFLDVEDASLRYHPDWPGLESIQGRFLLDDGHVTVWADKASLYDARVNDTRVEVGHDAVTDNLELAVHGHLQGPTANILRLLGESPLHKVIGNAFDGWQVEGQFQGDLVLGVSLQAPKEPYVAVDARLQDNRLQLTRQRLAFDAVSGPIGYRSANGLMSDGLTGQLWGEPLQALIASERVDDGVAMTITADAPVEVASIGQWLEWPWLEFAEGKTRVNAVIQIYPGFPTQLQLRSSLEGVAVDLPEPFMKPAAATWALRANIPLGDGLMDIAIGKKVRIGVMRDGENPLRVGLALGQVPFRLPQSEGVSVYGRLATFNWSDWQAPISRMIDRLSEKPVEDNEPGDSGFRVSDVLVDELTLFEQPYDSVLVSVNKQAGRWWVGAKSESIAGQVGLPQHDNEPYLIEFDRLFLAGGMLADDTDAPDPLQDIHWDDWPRMQVDIRQLKMGKTDFGEWKFHVEPAPDRLRIERLRASSQALHIDAEGGGAWAEWLRTGGQQQTSIHASVLVYDLEKVLQAVGLELGITAKEAVMAFDLQWPDSPLRPSVATMAGNAGFSFKKGFLKTGNRTQTGMLKVLTVFNLDTVLRRIQLDFSDLYQEGLAFDEAKAKWSLADGWLTITEPVEFRGPASHIVLQGRVDLVNDMLDNRLTVTLPMASSLPWLAAIAGGLPAAVGVYVASKVLEQQVDSFTSVVYEITGPRADPQVKFQRLIDADSLLPSWMHLRDKKEAPTPVEEPSP